MKPIFARPPCVIGFSNKNEYLAFLRKHGISYDEWGEKNIEKAWREIVEGDAVYSLAQDFGPISALPVRCICAVAIRVVLELDERGFFVLIEFVRNGDYYEPRQQQGSSLSEKMLLDRATGEPLEDPIETIQRCLSQEVNIEVPMHELIESSTFIAWEPVIPIEPVSVSSEPIDSKLPAPLGFGMGAKNVEIDFGFSNKYPALPCFRQVASYRTLLGPKHFFEKGHQDSATKYYSFWRSVHEHTFLESIPVHVIK